MMTVTAQTAASITGAQNWSSVREEFPDRVDAMASGLMVGDPAADAVIAEMFSEVGWSWSDIVAALDDPDGLDSAPPALRAFGKQACSPPEWFDDALLRAGADAWWRFGSLQSSTLYQSLIYGYQARGFIKPLVSTGRLTEGTWDRVQATARWVTLATAPGLMTPGAAGWVETLRIRLVHAMVRHHLRSDPDWDDAAWGVPINQTYAQLTITAGFLVLPMRIAKDFGIRYSRAELEAITHMWRWIGWVMGVDDELLPTSFGDAQLTYRISQQFRLQPDEESKVLVRALLDDGYRTDLGLPGPLNGAVHAVSRPFLRALFAAISTRWVDEDIAAAMGLRATVLHHVVDLARPIVWSREMVRATGLLGSERVVAQRELRLVTGRLGLDLQDLQVVGSRYAGADKGCLETVA
ncbi:oxygenase MpaB family protein [Gordonia sp. ABSL1-1]|uniref:oxygenase MpaB family protein n=1 Tax=Gordonia sp. ABSL1-1 TaxID=3053923 RepID=UPI0025723FDA|nr:oxygenase MpaB family protein [Gordonia sp. ABSL1-1]MDL9938140.1 oxygenase MpaB family protein [Gordonia sp. ABSL1-1]